jgi:hypothetical protein
VDDHEAFLRQERHEEMLDWIGPALTKACTDPFDYLVVLRNGMRIRFHSAEYTNGSAWITLIPRGYPGAEFEEVQDILGHRCPRGIDVRLADIMFAADAPDGS